VRAIRCPVCKLVIRCNWDGAPRKHRPGGLRSDVCSGSNKRPIPPAPAPAQPPILRGRMPLPGEGRTFSYEAPDPLTRDDVNRIMLTLLSHVEDAT
jgi:hypothetical protein